MVIKVLGMSSVSSFHNGSLTMVTESPLGGRIWGVGINSGHLVHNLVWTPDLFCNINLV